MGQALLDLPADILLQNVIRLLGLKDKLSLASTCHQGQSLLLSPTAWPEVSLGAAITDRQLTSCM